MFKERHARLTSKKTLFSSMSAMAFPAQIHRPPPNVMSIARSISARLASEHSRKRSGRNTSTSRPQMSSRRVSASVLWPMAVPSGTKMPLMVSPPGGTSL